MNVELQIFESVISFAVLVAIIYFLRVKNFFREEEGKSFSKLLIDVVLPAMIFFQLASHQITANQFVLIFIMFSSGVITITLSYFIAKLLTKDRQKIGAFMITSSFGSSALLGYPLIKMVFPHNPDALTDAVLISEFGVGLPLYTLCPVIAKLFSAGKNKEYKFITFLKSYIKSPVFFALILGIFFSVLKVDFKNSLLAPIKMLSQILSNGLGLLSCVILGLYLKPKSFRGVILLVIFSAIIEMGFQPFIASVQADIFGIGEIHKKILVFISSMPAAILGTVYAVRYDCAPETASVISYSHIIIALFSIPLVNLIM
jgi:predicted permease